MAVTRRSPPSGANAVQRLTTLEERVRRLEEFVNLPPVEVPNDAAPRENETLELFPQGQ